MTRKLRSPLALRGGCERMGVSSSAYLVLMLCSLSTPCSAGASVPAFVLAGSPLLLATYLCCFLDLLFLFVCLLAALFVSRLLAMAVLDKFCRPSWP